MTRTVAGLWALCFATLGPSGANAQKGLKFPAIDAASGPSETLPDLKLLVAPSQPGTLAYATLLRPAEQDEQKFLVSIARMSPEKLGAIQTSVRLNSNQNIFAPQFSPDAKTVLFKFGTPDERFGKYRIYFLDVGSQKLHPGPALALCYRTVRWSPNGRYLAFASGGDIEGREWMCDHERLQLHTYDIQTGKLRAVVTDSWAREFSWTNRNTLLYAALAPGSTVASQQELRPNIYEFAPEAGATKLVQKGATCPRLSPDGTWLAYWGNGPTPPGTKLGKRAQPRKNGKLGVYLHNLATGSSVAVNGIKREDFALAGLWAPDSETFVVGQYTYRKGIGKMRLGAVSTANGGWREVTTLTAADKAATLRNEIEPQFRMLDISYDGRHILVGAEEITGANDSIVQTRDLIYEVDVNGAMVKRVGVLSNPAGLDCRYQLEGR